MKKVAILCVLSLFALLIVLPITSSFNQTVGNPVLDHRTLRADGYPIPPLKKLHHDSTSLVADGYPIPPLKKLHRDSTSLVADGYPIPPLKKLYPDSAAAFVIA
jgi:hypothetical protein